MHLQFNYCIAITIYPDVCNHCVDMAPEYMNIFLVLSNKIFVYKVAFQSSQFKVQYENCYQKYRPINHFKCDLT